jgi:hypothetical protein
MAVEESTTTTTTTLPEDNSQNDLLRKIAAAIVGIIVIILFVLAAKWLGDRIKERFFPSTLPVVTPTTTPVPSNYPGVTVTPIPTYSTSPSTGPNDILYIVVGLMAVGGGSALVLSKKTS